MAYIKRFSALSMMSALMLTGALTLSACSKSGQTQEVGVDPAPATAAGDGATAQYADQPAVVQQGEPNTQVDPYTGSTVKENYAGEHPMAPQQTVGESLSNARENVKDAGREAGHDLKEAGQAVGQNVKEATHAAGQNLKQAGHETKEAGSRMKNEAKEEFDNN